MPDPETPSSLMEESDVKPEYQSNSNLQPLAEQEKNLAPENYSRETVLTGFQLPAAGQLAVPAQNPAFAETAQPGVSLAAATGYSFSRQPVLIEEGGIEPKSRWDALAAEQPTVLAPNLAFARSDKAGSSSAAITSHPFLSSGAAVQQSVKEDNPIPAAASRTGVELAMVLNKSLPESPVAQTLASGSTIILQSGQGQSQVSAMIGRQPEPSSVLGDGGDGILQSSPSRTVVDGAARMAAVQSGRAVSSTCKTENSQLATTGSESIREAYSLASRSRITANSLDGMQQYMHAPSSIAASAAGYVSARDARTIKEFTGKAEAPISLKLSVTAFQHGQQQTLESRPGAMMNTLAEGGNEVFIGPARHQNTFDLQKPASGNLLSANALPANQAEVQAQPFQFHTPASTAATFAPVAANPASIISGGQQEISIPVGQAAWEQAMAKHVIQAGKNQLQTMEIRLNPANLGVLNVRISLESDTASVVFSSHHAVVREAVEGAIPRLREMFSTSGMNLGDVNVANQNTAEQQGRQSSRQYHAGQTAVATAATQSEPVPESSKNSTEQLLDYYI
ncbi:flagellar hook-length control protein FliK [Thiolapillus sp.]